ncbi:Type II secretion system (T2SS), protein F [uncultured archaeon]|nr:Type II secretion system (T2SS), protein F [uncultured archaeon]
MSKPFIPFAPLPLNRSTQRILNGFCPLGASLKPLFPGLGKELDETGNQLTATEYLAGVIATSIFYFAVTFLVMLYAAYAFSPSSDGAKMVALAFSFVLAIFTFGYSLLYPRLLVQRASKDIERNLLFATRHLMIQTSAGVPLFESIVSISENYNDPKLDYGAISAEFGKIAKEVRGGAELTQALEDSAARIASDDYRRLMWQLANANKAGANVGFVLRQMMSYLSEEQKVKIKDYGSQLSPIAIFYMLVCVIAPTMGIIFLVIISSLASITITWLMLGMVLVISLVAQVVFIGLIKSKRPVVAI